MLNSEKISNLKKIASKLRFDVINNSYKTGTPHLGSCLSCIDLLVYLYWHELNINPALATDTKRDRFILSKGHAAPALFYVLAERGFYDKSTLLHYGNNGSVFAEHPPTPTHLPGIEAATGSLGHGLPIGLGIAKASKMTNLPYRVFVILGDGECNEGSVWEAAMLASAIDLNNLFVIIDYNKWQATGRSNDVLHLKPLIQKWRSFGWDTEEIDGHDFQAINRAINLLTPSKNPKAIIANTIKGKGVSFMEDDNNWHYLTPNIEQVSLAKKELGIMY